MIQHRSISIFTRLGIALFQQNVVRKFSVDRRKFKPMIVIGELNSRLLARFPGAIKSFGRTLPAIGPLANIVVNVGIDEIFVADHMGRIEHAGELFSQALIRRCARTGR